MRMNMILNIREIKDQKHLYINKWEINIIRTRRNTKKCYNVSLIKNNN